MVGLVAVEMTQDLAASLDDGVVFDRACLVEKRHDVFVRHRLDAVDAKEGRLTPDRMDLLDEPLKQLGGLGILGQDPAGPAQADRAHPLQFPPDTDTVSRRRWR